MAYTVKPLCCDPTKLNGPSEKLILSHWQNNYGGAVRRLNAIAARLAELDFAEAIMENINWINPFFGRPFFAGSPDTQGNLVFRALRYSAEEIARAKATAGV